MKGILYWLLDIHLQTSWRAVLQNIKGHCLGSHSSPISRVHAKRASSQVTHKRKGRNGSSPAIHHLHSPTPAPVQVTLRQSIFFFFFIREVWLVTHGKIIMHFVTWFNFLVFTFHPPRFFSLGYFVFWIILWTELHLKTITCRRPINW